MDDEDRDVARGRRLLVVWVVVGTASVVLLALRLLDSGWDTGAGANVAMIVASVAGVISERGRARGRRPE